MNAKALILSIAMAAPLLCAAQTPPPPEPGDAERQAQEEKARAADEKLKEAQEKLRAAQEKARQAQEETREKIVIMEHRPRLGVIVNTDKNPDSDAIGALLEGVTPGGPADEAGLKAGDIIVKYNGVELKGPYPAADADESGPGIKLMDMARKLKAGDKVAIEYRRGNNTKTATVTAREIAPKDLWVLKNIKIPNVEIPDIVIPDIPELLSAYGPGRGLDLELAQMNPGLGEYFGTSEGLLVLRAPKDAAFKLQAGDVILAIGGRKPDSPSQAFRILDSYEPGEAVNLDVMRKQKKITLAIKMPERKETRSYQWKQRYEPPAPPEPPEPPSPPAHAPSAST